MPVCKTFIVSLGLILLGAALTTSASLNDVDCKSMLVQLREIYQYLVASGELRAFHELVRKDGRIPSLRLRFGKRSEPDWREAYSPSNIMKDNYVD